MEKQEAMGSYTHGISLAERKNLIVTGVKKIENFDTEQFLLETSMGFILVKGEDLELIKLDTIQGNVSIRGLVSSINYLEEGQKKNKENLNNEYKNTNNINDIFLCFWNIFFNVY